MDGEEEGLEELHLRMAQLHRVLDDTYSQLDRLEEEQEESYDPLEPPGVQQNEASSGGRCQTITIMANHTLRGILRLSRRVSRMRLRLLKKDIEAEIMAAAQRLADVVDADSSRGEASGEQNKTDEGLSAGSWNQLVHSSSSSSTPSSGPRTRESSSPEESRKGVSPSSISVTDSPSAATSLYIAGTSSSIHTGANNQVGCPSLGEDKMHITTATNSIADGENVDSFHSTSPSSEMAIPLTGLLVSVDAIQTEIVTPTHTVHLKADKTTMDEMVKGASEPMADGDSSTDSSSNPQKTIVSLSADVHADAKVISKRVTIETQIFPTEHSFNSSNSPSTGNCLGNSLIREGNHMGAKSATQISTTCQNTIISSTKEIHSETDETSAVTHTPTASFNEQDNPFSAGRFLDSSLKAEVTVSPSNSSAGVQNKEGINSKADILPCEHSSPGCQDKTEESLSLDIRSKTLIEDSTGHGQTEVDGMRETMCRTDDSSGCQDKTEGCLSIDSQSQPTIENKNGNKPKADNSPERERAVHNYQSMNTNTNTESHSLGIMNDAVVSEGDTREHQSSSPRRSDDRWSRNKHSPSDERRLKAVSFSISPQAATKSDISSTTLPEDQRYLEGSPSVRTGSKGIHLPKSPQKMRQETPSPIKISDSPQEMEDTSNIRTRAKTYRYSSPQTVTKLESPTTTESSDSQTVVDGSLSTGVHMEVFHFSTSQIKKEPKSPSTTTSSCKQEIDDSPRRWTRSKTFGFSTSRQRLTKQKRHSARVLSGRQECEDDSPSAGTHSKVFQLSVSPQVMVKQESPSTTTSLHEELSPPRTRSKAVRLSRSSRTAGGRRHTGEATPRSSRFRSSIVTSSVTTRSRSFLKLRESLSYGNTVSSSISTSCQDDVEISPSEVTCFKAERLSPGNHQTKWVSQAHDESRSKACSSGYRRKNKVSPSSCTQPKVGQLSADVKSKNDSSSRAHGLSSGNSSPELQRKTECSLSASTALKGGSISATARTKRNCKRKEPKITSTGNVHEMLSISSSIQAGAIKTSGEMPVKSSNHSNPDKRSAGCIPHRDNEIDSPAANTRFKFLNVSLIAQKAERKLPQHRV